MEREEILRAIDENIDSVQKKMEYYIKVWNKEAAKKCSSFVDRVYEYNTDEMDIPKLKRFLLDIKEWLSIL